MRYLSIIAAVLLFVLPAQAQSTLSGETIRAITRSARIPIITTRKVKGSPYLTKDWQTGYVVLKSGNKSKNVFLKFDIHNNRLLYKKKEKVLIVIPKSMRGFVLLNGPEKKVFKKGFKSSDNDISSDQFLQVFYYGKVKLIEKHYTILHKANGSSLYTGKVPDRYVSKHNYYLITNDGQFHEVKLKEKDILHALSSHQKKLRAYAKSKHLKFKNPQDLGKILHEYDTMMAQTP